MEIDTARLRLLPHSPENLLALIEGVPQFEEKTGLVAAEGLRDFFESDDVSPVWLAQLRTSPAADPWALGFAVVHQDSGEVIGMGGFKGPPDGDGMVEIAYGIVPGYEGRGYATEVATALLAFALDDPRVRVVRAHTLPEPGPSPRVLTKCGFECLGEVVEPEDGTVWRWEHARASA